MGAQDLYCRSEGKYPADKRDVIYVCWGRCSLNGSEAKRADCLVPVATPANSKNEKMERLYPTLENAFQPLQVGSILQAGRLPNYADMLPTKEEMAEALARRRWEMTAGVWFKGRRKSAYGMLL